MYEWYLEFPVLPCSNASTADLIGIAPTNSRLILMSIIFVVVSKSSGILTLVANDLSKLNLQGDNKVALPSKTTHLALRSVNFKMTFSDALNFPNKQLKNLMNICPRF